MNVPTKRPDDYFAQMAKTDEHMQKVMQNWFLIVELYWRLNFSPWVSDSKGPRLEADGRGAAGKGSKAERTAEVWKEGAGRGATTEAEGEKRYVGPGKGDVESKFKLSS